MDEIQIKAAFFLLLEGPSEQLDKSTIVEIYSALPAQTVDNVDLKDGLLSNRVCIVKFPVVEDYFSCNKTHTELQCTLLSLPK